jgi:hypothetical protein
MECIGGGLHGSGFLIHEQSSKKGPVRYMDPTALSAKVFGSNWAYEAKFINELWLIIPIF